MHGDYHLGHVLWSEGDFYLLDFGGEPARPLAERRLKQSPLKDVAGMLRSFSYAASAALFAHASVRGSQTERLEQWVRAWRIWVTGAFVKGYMTVPGIAPLVPAGTGQRETLLRLFVLDKAFTELNHELNSRPDWARIPLKGILELLPE